MMQRALRLCVVAARWHSGEFAELPREVGLIGVPKRGGKISQHDLLIRCETLGDTVETLNSEVLLGRYANRFIELCYEVSRTIARLALNVRDASRLS